MRRQHTKFLAAFVLALPGPAVAKTPTIGESSTIRSISAPQTANRGTLVPISWRIALPGSKVVHTNIHWGTSPGRYSFFGTAFSGGEGDYADSIQVPSLPNPADTVYYTIHALVRDSNGRSEHHFSREATIALPGPRLITVTRRPPVWLAHNRATVVWSVALPPDLPLDLEVSQTQVCWGTSPKRLNLCPNMAQPGQRTYRQTLVVPIPDTWIYARVRLVVGRWIFYSEPFSFATGSLQPWPTAGAGPRRSGFNRSERGAPPLTLAWTLPQGSPIPTDPPQAQPAIADAAGRVYAINGSQLRALHGADGTSLWEQELKRATAPDAFGVPQPVSSTRLGALTRSGGRVHFVDVSPVGQFHSTVFTHARSALTGAFSWERLVGAQPTDPKGNVSSFAALGNVYVSSLNSSSRPVQAYRADGSLLPAWVPQQRGEWVAAPAMGRRQLLTCELSYTRSSFVLQASSPHTYLPLWSVDLPDFAASIVVYGGLAFAQGATYLAAIDLAAQTVVWTARTNLRRIDTLAADANAVYTVRGRKLSARNARTGELNWEFEADTELLYQPAIAGGYVYVGGNEGLFVVDAATGAEVWADRHHGGWPVVANGHVYLSGLDTLRAYRLRGLGE